MQAGLADLGVRASNDPLFVPDLSPQVRTSRDGAVSIPELAIPYEESAPEAEESVPAAMASIPSAEHAVGGITADNVDYTNQQVRRMPWVAFPAFPTCGAGGDNALGTALADRAR